MEAARAALGDSDNPLWLSFTLQDDDMPEGAVRLSSGENAAAAVLINCSRAEGTSAVLQVAWVVKLQGTALSLRGLRQHSGMPKPTPLNEIHTDLEPERYLGLAPQWVAEGTSIVGGCCDITPQHIAALAQAMP